MDIINVRNKTTHFLYKNIVKPIFFMFDPELMHNIFIDVGALLGSNKLTKSITSLFFNYQSPILEQNISSLKFRNPVGLSAGFDKNGQMVSIMDDVGFGFVEIGSITAFPCAGNKGKRIERLVNRKGLWVYLGLNNFGAKAIYEKLKNKKFKIPLFVSAAKTNSKETINEYKGLQDYLFTLKTFKDRADAFVLNISCPNAFGGCDFASPSSFELLAKEVYKLKLKQPILVKISPDLTNLNLNKIISISEKYNLSGFICTNLSKKHEFSKGGLSGKIVEKRSNEVLSYVYKKCKFSKKKFIIIGVGGIFSAEDAYKKIKLGANLVQLITGLIYEGPGLIGEINYNLTKLLKKDGYKNIGEAVGADIR